MTYVYQADTWCDSCGERIRAELTREGLAPEDPSDEWSYDSDEFPKGPVVDEATDGPDHCAAAGDCLEAIDLGAYGLAEDAPLFGAESRRIGALLSDGLTDEGVNYTLEMMAEKDPTPYQRALYRLWRDEFDLPDVTDLEDVYVVCVNLPGCLPEMDPYAVRGKDEAYDCARAELDDGDSFGYSRAEWASALAAGGASVSLESGYVMEVSPIAGLDLPTADLVEYLRAL